MARRRSNKKPVNIKNILGEPISVASPKEAISTYRPLTPIQQQINNVTGVTSNASNRSIPMNAANANFKPIASTVDYGIHPSPIVKGTAPSNYTPINTNYKSSLSAGLPNIKGIRQASVPDTSIANNLKQFGSNISNLAKTSTPALEAIGSGVRFANKAFPVINLGLESMSAASDISANPQMDTLDKISRYSEAAGNSFGVPFPEMANSTVNMLTGMDQETASQKLAREAGDKTNYQYAVGAISEADANNLATGQDDYTKNHPTYPSQMINRNTNTQPQPTAVEATNDSGANTISNFKPLVNVPELTPTGGVQSNVMSTDQVQQPKTNILGEQIPMDKLPKGTGYVNDKLYDSTTGNTRGMFTGMNKERDASLDSYGKVRKDSDFYKRNKQAMSNLSMTGF